MVRRLLSATGSPVGDVSFIKTFIRLLGGTIATGGAINKSVFMRLSGLVSTSATLSSVIAGLDIFIGKTRLSGSWAKAALIGTFHDSVKSLRGSFSSRKRLDGEL